MSANWEGGREGGRVGCSRSKVKKNPEKKDHLQDRHFPLNESHSTLIHLHGSIMC